MQAESEETSLFSPQIFRSEVERVAAIDEPRGFASNANAGKPDDTYAADV